jgi:hypothetical protein
MPKRVGFRFYSYYTVIVPVIVQVTSLLQQPCGYGVDAAIGSFRQGISWRADSTFKPIRALPLGLTPGLASSIISGSLLAGARRPMVTHRSPGHPIETTL